MEFVFLDNHHLSEAHVIKRNQAFCVKCRRHYKEQMRETGFFSNLVDPVHITEEPVQTFQCLYCNGSVRGYTAIAEEGDGGFSLFGIGRRMKRGLPWVDEMRQSR
jgi:hypothetical protein